MLTRWVDCPVVEVLGQEMSGKRGQLDDWGGFQRGILVGGGVSAGLEGNEGQVGACQPGGDSRTGAMEVSCQPAGDGLLR